jgi:hypothetical protein
MIYMQFIGIGNYSSIEGWGIYVNGLDFAQSSTAVTTLSKLKLSCSTSRRRKLPKLGQTFPHHLSLFTVTHAIFLQQPLLPFHISSFAIKYFFRCHFIFRQLLKRGQIFHIYYLLLFTFPHWGILSCKVEPYQWMKTKIQELSSSKLSKLMFVLIAQTTECVGWRFKRTIFVSVLTFPCTELQLGQVFRTK